MDNLNLQQLEMLVYLFVGLVVLTAIALVIYVIVSVRRRGGRTTITLTRSDDVMVRPSLQVAGKVLALIRDEPGAPMQVEIEGTRYRNLAEVGDPQVKRQIVDAALELIQFTGVLGDADLKLVPVDKTERWREDLREGSQAELERAHSASARGPTQPQPSPAPEEVEERFLTLLSELGQTSLPEKPTLVSSVQHSLQAKPLESSPSRTVVDDIEEILQRRIRLVPALVGRGLHVRPGPGGRVIFTFEGQEVQSVDDIPNLTAREMIKDAIREWDETT